MRVTIEMASSINGLIAYENGSEDFLSDRNYQIMLDFLRDYDCLVWGNTTFKNVISWGDEYINDLKGIEVIIFSKTPQVSNYPNVTYCTSLEEFYEICKTKNINKIFVSGGATINTMFMKANIVDDIIINYNPYILNKGINLFAGDFFENKLILNKVIQAQEGILQVWYKVLKNNDEISDIKDDVIKVINEKV